MLNAIQSQNITLKTVRKSMILKDRQPGANDIVGILARTLLQRRNDIAKEEGGEEEETWDDK